MLPVSISDHGKLIMFGEYIIDALNFGNMALYVAEGGHFGWPKYAKPDYADPIINAIKHSEHPIFLHVRE